MIVQELRAGLWRWTLPHPEWTPEQGAGAGWDEQVGCVYYEASESVVLIDPLVPTAGTEDAERFWRALDRDVQRAKGEVAVLLTVPQHERSAQAVYDRYRAQHGVSVWVHAVVRDRVGCRVTHAFEEGDALPGGVRALPLQGLRPHDDEVMYYLPPHQALVAGDALMGVGHGALRVCRPPRMGQSEAGLVRYREQLLPSLRRALALPVEMVLTSHGAMALERAREALDDAIASALDGE